MRKAILLSIFIIVSILTWSQTENEKKLESLRKDLKEAINEENYINANFFEKRIELRMSIDSAVKAKDYEKAAEKQLALRVFVKEYGNRIYNYYDKVDDKLLHFYMDFSPASLTVWNYKDYNSLSGQTTERSYLSFSPGLKLGNTFYFKSNSKKYRMGIDINYAIINMNIQTVLSPIPEGVSFGVARPGFTFSYYFEEANGFDLKAHIAPIYAFTGHSGYEGIGVNPSVSMKFWFSRIALSLNYNYGYFSGRDSHMHQVALNLGFRLQNGE